MSNEIVKISDALPDINNESITDDELWNVKHHQIKVSCYYAIEAIITIKDRELYLKGGYDSFRDYVDRGTPFSLAQAYIFVTIGTEMLPLLSEAGKSPEEIASIFNSLGNKKLQIMAMSSKENRSTILALFDKGEANLVDGSTLYMDEVERMCVPDLKKKLVIRDEEIKKLKAEKNVLKSDFEAREKGIEEREKISKIKEDKYGKKAVKIEQIRENLERSRSNLFDSEQYLFQCDLTEDDPSGLLKDIGDFIQRIDAFHNKAMNVYGWIVDRMEEYD